MSLPIVKHPDHVLRRRLLVTGIYYIGFIALGLTAASLGPTLTGLAENTHSTLGEISILFTARSMGYMLGALLAGRVYDRLRGHRVMAMSMLVLGATLALTPLIPILWLLAALLVGMGIAEGTFDVGGNTLLVWLHRDAVGPFMNALHFFFGFGAFVAPVIVGLAITTSHGIALAYWILAALTVIPALALVTQPSPVMSQRGERSARGAAQPGVVTLLVLFFFLYVGAEVSFGGWIFTYAQSQKLASGAQAAYLTSAFWGAFTVGRLLSIPIARFLRPRRILGIDLVGCMISVVAMLLWSDIPAIGWIGAIGTGLFMASIFPTAILLAERRMALTGFITSLFFLGSSAGAMVVPFLIGQLFERFGPSTIMQVILATLALDMLVFAMLVWSFPVARYEKG